MLTRIKNKIIGITLTDRDETKVIVYTDDYQEIEHSLAYTRKVLGEANFYRLLRE